MTQYTFTLFAFSAPLPPHPRLPTEAPQEQVISVLFTAVFPDSRTVPGM